VILFVALAFVIVLCLFCDFVHLCALFVYISFCVFVLFCFVLFCVCFVFVNRIRVLG
jgi:hypothetical protein